MTNELNNTLNEVLANLGKDRAIGTMPITKGQVLTFIDGADGVEIVEAEINGVKTTYGVFKTKEGYNVPFSQIARDKNGLGLTKATRNEALAEFAERIDGEYSVTVEDVKKLESSFGEGKVTYLKFKA